MATPGRRDEIIDAALALSDPDAGWEDQLRTVADGLFAVADRHPTVFPMVLHRSYVSEDAIAVMQQMYQILRQAGIPTDALPRIERMISTALLGYRSSPGSRRWRDELAADVDDLVLMIRVIAAPKPVEVPEPVEDILSLSKGSGSTVRFFDRLRTLPIDGH